MDDGERRHDTIASALEKWHYPILEDPDKAAPELRHGTFSDSMALTHCICYGAAFRMLDFLLERPELFARLRVAHTSTPSNARNLTGALVDKIRYECRRGEIALDTYDADYILGVMTQWLAENDAALTSKGVRRFRRK